jgi:divalent metal cation (Fe/Co/Zn/Cd) transporter
MRAEEIRAVRDMHPDVARHAAELAMVLLGATSVVLLVAYGLLATGGTGTDPVFWILVLAFLVYIGWDVRRHVRAMRSRGPEINRRNS